MKWLWMLLAAPVFGQDMPPERQAFLELRAKHAGGVAAKEFSARLTDAGSKKLLREKIPSGDYFVEVLFHADRGLQLRVKNTDSFYENALSAYERHINEMLLPLLSSSGYRRFQQSFVIAQPKPDIMQVGFNKGDAEVAYMFRVGKLGLVERLDYFEDKKKKFAVAIVWKEVDGKYIPASFKTISYDGTRVAGDFELTGIEIPAN